MAKDEHVFDLPSEDGHRGAARLLKNNYRGFWSIYVFFASFIRKRQRNLRTLDVFSSVSHIRTGRVMVFRLAEFVPSGSTQSYPNPVTATTINWNHHQTLLTWGFLYRRNTSHLLLFPSGEPIGFARFYSSPPPGSRHHTHTHTVTVPHFYVHTIIHFSRPIALLW